MKGRDSGKRRYGFGSIDPIKGDTPDIFNTRRHGAGARSHSPHLPRLPQGQLHRALRLSCNTRCSGAGSRSHYTASTGGAPGDFSDPLVTPAACLVDPAGARVAAYVLQSGNYPSKLTSLYFVTYNTISVLAKLSNIKAKFETNIASTFLTHLHFSLTSNAPLSLPPSPSQIPRDGGRHVRRRRTRRQQRQQLQQQQQQQQQQRRRRWQQNSGTGAEVARVLGDTTGDTYKRATRREALATPPATKGHERQNGEKRALPLRGGGLGKLGCSHVMCTQVVSPRNRARVELCPGYGAATRGHFSPFSFYGQRIRRWRR